jgi:hypothetical protein
MDADSELKAFNDFSIDEVTHVASISRRMLWQSTAGRLP